MQPITLATSFLPPLPRATDTQCSPRFSLPIAAKLPFASFELAAKWAFKTAVVYSTADKDAAYLKLADEAICIGDGAAKSNRTCGSDRIMAAR